MEDQVQQVTQSVPVREIGVITSEIKDICRQAQSMALMYAVEIGRRLTEVKEVLPHGEWGNWLKNEVEFSERSAQNFIKLFNEYGSSQLSLFTVYSNPQTFADLPYSKALALLSIPADEREEFAEEVKADEISLKELQQAIKERDAAQKQLAEISEERDQLSKSLAKAEETSRTVAANAHEALSESEKLKQELSESERKMKELRKKLKEAKDNPKISEEILEKAREELRVSIRQELEASSRQAILEFEDKLALAEKKVEAAEALQKHAEEQRERVEGSFEDLQKKLKMANPKVTVFKTLFEDLQETYSKLCVVYADISEESPEIAKGLSGAIKSLGEMMIGGANGS